MCLECCLLLLSRACYCESRVGYYFRKAKMTDVFRVLSLTAELSLLLYVEGRVLPRICNYPAVTRYACKLM